MKRTRGMTEEPAFLYLDCRDGCARLYANAKVPGAARMPLYYRIVMRLIRARLGPGLRNLRLRGCRVLYARRDDGATAVVRIEDGRRGPESGIRADLAYAGMRGWTEAFMQRDFGRETNRADGRIGGTDEEGS